MISEARLRTLAREQNSGVGLTEKDYVNSWILRAIFISPLKDKLVFKGGTALSKIHFPERWRFSEDLDFTVRGNLEDFDNLETTLREALNGITGESGIDFTIRSFHTNPDYAQIKVQYDATLQQKNTTNLDIFAGEEIYFEAQNVKHSFENIAEFGIMVYQVEEILVEKLRSLFQRARARENFRDW